MGMSRLLSSALVIATACGATILACGDDGGGGGGGGSADAKVFMDSKVFMDAPPGMAGLGQACSQTMMCPSSAPQCLGTGSNTPTWCTAQCGMTAGSAMAPAGGDAICSMFTMTTETPKCVFYLPPSGSQTQYVWLCGILCGTSGSNMFGTCPSNLTCQGNVCR